MITQDEKDWREMFQVQTAEQPFHIQTEPGECNGNCVTAKELKCVCRCGGKNHGAALKQNVKSLDEFNDCSSRSQEAYEDPVAATFNPQEYEQELAILA